MSNNTIRDDIMGELSKFYNQITGKYSEDENRWLFTIHPKEYFGEGMDKRIVVAAHLIKTFPQHKMVIDYSLGYDVDGEERETCL